MHVLSCNVLLFHLSISCIIIIILIIEPHVITGPDNAAKDTTLAHTAGPLVDFSEIEKKTAMIRAEFSFV